MRNRTFSWARRASQYLFFFGGFLLPDGLNAATQSTKMATVPKWRRFEQSFKSHIAYSNALQEVTLRALFTSPSGQTNLVYGFWDGGNTWRIRFSPDLPGRWTFETTCSDAGNRQLHNKSGQFLCTAATGPSRFQRHGTIKVSSDHHHFQHADATPFFWLADTVWDGPRLSEPADWDFYVHARAQQKFTVAQWVLAPGKDTTGQTAFTGSEQIAINPDFFKKLEVRIETLSAAGILSAIVPLSEMAHHSAPPLPGDQAALLLRYVVARFGADPVAWLLLPNPDDPVTSAQRWRKIGNVVFGSIQHAPVILYTDDSSRFFDDFRDQTWLDAFACASLADLSEDALKHYFDGPMPKEWTKEPARPLIAFAPAENAPAREPNKRFSSDNVRHVAYWSLLIAPPAGLSYAGQGLIHWDTTVDTPTSSTPGVDLPLWKKALFMPAAKQMAHLADLMNSIDFWRLTPQPKVTAAQPGIASLRRFVAAARSEAKDLTLVYVPEDRNLEVLLEALPPAPNVTWLDPRTGQTNPAVGLVGGRTVQFPTPDPGDWLFVAKGTRQ